jgi:hypothetical protein
MLVGTVIAGAAGDALGPIALLNLQGSAYVVAGVFALIALAPSMLSAAPRRADADSAA